MTEDQKGMVRECLEAEKGLSNWEIEFLENLERNFWGIELSEKQAVVLERIDNKVLNQSSDTMDY
jgi:hypothetical protein